MWHWILFVGITGVVSAFTKEVIINIVGNLVTDKLQHWCDKYWRRRVLFMHGVGHVQKDTLHEPRNPMKCRDGDCPTLQTARVTVLPRSPR